MDGMRACEAYAREGVTSQSRLLSPFSFREGREQGYRGRCPLELDPVSSCVFARRARMHVSPTEKHFWIIEFVNDVL